MFCKNDQNCCIACLCKNFQKPRYFLNQWCILGLTGSTLDHRSLPNGFESQHGHIWRVFHLWLHFITVGGHSVHLAHHVHKSGHKTSIIIITFKPALATQNDFIQLLWSSFRKISNYHLFRITTEYFHPLWIAKM